jgi:thiamine-phosphate pyrophosphorylase
MPVRPVDFRLYLITDRKLFSSMDSFMVAVKEALAAGVRVVQLREKDLPTRELLEMAYKFREMTESCKAKLFISDRLDIALSVGADGVHLGQSGIPVRAVRNVVRDTLMIGCSTHSVDEAVEADNAGADFITFGPLFETPSKLKYGEPLGLEALREVSKKTNLPIFGIGGIKSNSIDDVLKAGASGIALISGILSGGAEADTAFSAREYLTKAGERR